MELAHWDSLDTLILTKIFEYLPFSDRFSASLTCRRWYDSFKSAKIWHRLNVSDHTFCNEYGTLDYDRTRAYIGQVGHHIQTISIDMKHNFSGLYQFLVLLQWFTNPKHYECPAMTRPLNRLWKFSLAIPRSHTCISTNSDGLKLFGIGGLVVSALMHLLLRLPNLTELVVINLCVERYEANRLLDYISVALSASMKHLTLVNLTESHCALTQIEMFSNLETLRVTPQQIDTFLIRSIGLWTRLRDLVIVQDEFTPITTLPCSASAWSSFSSTIRLHLYTNERNCDLMLHMMAPFYSITRHGIKKRMTSQIIQNYGQTLSVYVTASSLIHEPCDADVLRLVRECDLNVLVISEPITTHTLLLVALLNRTVRKLYVRKSVVIERILRADDPHETCHSHQLGDIQLLSIANSLTDTVQKIKQSLPHSYFLDDSEFERIHLNVPI